MKKYPTNTYDIIAKSISDSYSGKNKILKSFKIEKNKDNINFKIKLNNSETAKELAEVFINSNKIINLNSQSYNLAKGIMTCYLYDQVEYKNKDITLTNITYTNDINKAKVKSFRLYFDNMDQFSKKFVDDHMPENISKLDFLSAFDKICDWSVETMPNENDNARVHVAEYLMNTYFNK